MPPASSQPVAEPPFCCAQLTLSFTVLPLDHRAEDISHRRVQSRFGDLKRGTSCVSWLLPKLEIEKLNENNNGKEVLKECDEATRS